MSPSSEGGVSDLQTNEIKLHPEKAPYPKLVTLLGISMDVKPPIPRNAFVSILVTLLGTMVDLHPCINVLVDVSMMALQSSRESYLGLLTSTLITDKFWQHSKGFEPMFVTLPGIVTDVNPQSLKADTSMEQPSGISTDVSP